MIDQQGWLTLYRRPEAQRDRALPLASCPPPPIAVRVASPPDAAIACGTGVARRGAALATTVHEKYHNLHVAAGYASQLAHSAPRRKLGVVQNEPTVRRIYSVGYVSLQYLDRL